MKKSILILAAILITTLSEAQTSFETKLLAGLNKYRISKGLVPVSYNASASGISKYHASYLDKCTLANHGCAGDSDKGHDERFDLPGFKEMTFEQRAATVKGVTFVGEIQYQGFIIKDETDENLVVASIIKGFDGSQHHKEIMSFPFPDDPSLKAAVGLSVLKKPSNVPGFSEYVLVIDFGYIEIP